MSPNLVLENHPCSPNITVGKAVCSLFFRPMPDTAWEKLVEEIQQTAEQMGLEVQLLPPLPPLHTPADRPSVRETLRLLGQSAPQTVCYATDGCCFHSLSDLIVLGPGSIEQAHRPDEWIAIAELQRGREVFEQQFRHFACL